MKAAALIAALFGLAMAWPAVAQTPAGQAPPAETSAAAAPSEPKILNAPKPAEKPVAASEPYAGQKPATTATATPAAAAEDAPPTAASAPAAKAAATAAKAAEQQATEGKPTQVPEGPAVKPIGQAAVPATVEKSASKETKSDAVPTVAKPEPKPTLLVSIDLTSQKLSVTENGEQRYKWSISSGRTGYLTPKGTFRPVWMSKMWYSKKYDYAPMPHAIFFHGGAAIHGTDSVYALGRPASHGCVRLSPANAATLFRLVEKHGKQFTRITVFGTPKGNAIASSEDEDGRRIDARSRRYQEEPEWNDDDYDDGPPPPPSRRRTYSDSNYDQPYRSGYPPRQRRYERDYYGDGF